MTQEDFSTEVVEPERRIKRKDHNPQQHQDWTRAGLAFAMLAFVIYLGVVAIDKVGTDSFSDMKDIIAVFIGPVFGFLGYYIGKAQG